MRGEFIDVAGTRLYYYAAGVRGAGEPVVLIHGFPASSHLWSAIVPLVPEGHRVVVPDLLGFGRSDPPRVGKPTPPLAITGHADRLVALLDELRVDRACVAGQGIGAAVALAVATRHPLRVTRLCLINAVTQASWPRDARMAAAVATLSPVLPRPWLLAMVRRWMLASYADSTRIARSVDHYLRPFTGRDGSATLVQHLRALTARDAAAALPSLASTRLAIPIAIVWGAGDPVLSLRNAHELRAALPGATLDVIAGGHYSPDESPEQVAAVLHRLLTATPGVSATTRALG